MKRRSRLTLSASPIALLLLLSLLPGVGAAPATQAAQSPCRQFPESGQSVCGKFLAYWLAHGELPQQGFPISGEMQEKSDIDGNTYTVQYFERAVFELHPENQAPYDVLLSLLGSLEYARKYPNGAPGQQPNRSTGSSTFPETGKRLGGLFLAYWQVHGGLMQQGYPISDEFTEVSDLNGKPYTVQYFERAVFELHPENRPPYDVLLSQLGTFRYHLKHSTPAPSPTPAPTSTPIPPLLKLAYVDLAGQALPAYSLAWSPDGKLLAVSPGRGTPAPGVPVDYDVRLWQADGTPAARLAGHTDLVYTLDWSPDGHTLASGSQDGTVRLWTAGGALQRTIHTGAGSTFTVAWSPDGRLLATGSLVSPSDNRAQLWRPDGTLVATLPTDYSGGKFYNVAWSPDGRFLVGGATDYKLWKADATEVFHLERCAHCTPSWALAWSPDSRLWGVGDESGNIYVYDTQGNRVAAISNEGSVDSMAWSPDGQYLAGGDGVGIWRPDGTPVRNLADRGERVTAVAWSPDSSMIASGSYDGIFHLWRADGTLLYAEKFADPMQQVAWSPDSKLLAAGAGPLVRVYTVPPRMPR